MPPPRKVYVLFGDERRGPFAPEELLREGVTARTLVWYSGCPDWLPAGEARDLEDYVGPPEPPHRLDRHDNAYPRRPSRWADRFHQPHSEEYLRMPYRVGSTAFLIGQITLLSCGLFSLFGFWLDFVAARDRGMQGFLTIIVLLAILLGFVAAISLVVGTVGYLTFLYRGWELVQDEYTDTSPGAAIGLLFVPVFNLYWCFVAVRGLAVAANEYATRHRLRAPRASHMLGLAVCLNYVLYPAWPLSFIGLACNIFVFPAFAKSLYGTLRCFCKETRLEETDRDLIERPHSSPGSLAWGLPAQLIAWIAVPTFVIAMIATADIHGRLMRGFRGGRFETELMIAMLFAFLGAVGLGVSFVFARLASLASQKNDELLHATEPVRHEPAGEPKPS